MSDHSKVHPKPAHPKATPHIRSPFKYKLDVNNTQVQCVPNDAFYAGTIYPNKQQAIPRTTIKTLETAYTALWTSNNRKKFAVPLFTKPPLITTDDYLRPLFTKVFTGNNGRDAKELYGAVIGYSSKTVDANNRRSDAVTQIIGGKLLAGLIDINQFMAEYAGGDTNAGLMTMGIPVAVFTQKSDGFEGYCMLQPTDEARSNAKQLKRPVNQRIGQAGL